MAMLQSSMSTLERLSKLIIPPANLQMNGVCHSDANRHPKEQGCRVGRSITINRSLLREHNRKKTYV